MYIEVMFCHYIDLHFKFLILTLKISLAFVAQLLVILEQSVA